MTEAQNLLISQEQKFAFDNVYGELDFFKKRCDVLEKDLFKSQTQIKKLEILLKKAQDYNAINGKNMNNTSIPFLLPSEFKTLWENLSKDLILEAFECFYDDYIVLAHLTQDIVLLTYQETFLFIKQKVSLVVKDLNIKLESEEALEKFIPKFKIIFQEHFSSIFMLTEEFVKKIKNSVMECIRQYEYLKTEDIEYKVKEFERDLEKKSFHNLIQNLFKLCIYMLLHDPILTISVAPYKDRKITYLYYNKSELLNIEGFGNDHTPCIIILPPPILRKNFSFNGIKPAVYCVQKSSEEMIAECEKNKVINANKSVNISVNMHCNHNIFVSPKKQNKNSVTIEAQGNGNGNHNSSNTQTPSKSKEKDKNKEKEKDNPSSCNTPHTPHSTEKKEKDKDKEKPDFGSSFSSHIKEKRKSEPPLSFSLKNKNLETFLEQKEKEAQDEEKVQKNYDQPLIMKNSNSATQAYTISTNLNNINNTQPAHLSNKVMYKPITFPTKNKTKTNSRSSSITESMDTSNDILGNFPSNSVTKSSRVANATPTSAVNASNVLSNTNCIATDNTCSTPLRYIPTNQTSAGVNSVPNFNVVRNKNCKQGFISDNVSGKENEKKMTEEKNPSVNVANNEEKSILNEKSYGIDTVNSNNQEFARKKDCGIEIKYDNYLRNYFNSKQLPNNDTGKASTSGSLNTLFNLNRKSFLESTKAKEDLNSYLNQNINSNSIKASTTGLRATPKDKKLESRIYINSPNNFILVTGTTNGNLNSIDHKTDQDYPLNTQSTHQGGESLQSKLKTHYNYLDLDRDRDDPISNRCGSAKQHAFSPGDLAMMNDMKFNGPKRDDFSVKISNIKDKDIDNVTPTHSKTLNKNDIKSQIGKFYNKVLNDGSKEVNSIVNIPSQNREAIHNSNSVKSVLTTSAISEKAPRDKKFICDNSNSTNTNILKMTHSKGHFTQQKILK